MFALLTLLSVVTLSILINRIATIALILTGLSRDEAQFQARSVSTGTGFTTDESEHMTRQPARRRIAMLLMLVQNVGLVTIMSTLVLSFVGSDASEETLLRGALLAGGLLALLYLAHSDWVDRHLSRFIERLLRRYTDLHVQDYAALLHVHEGYRVARLEVENGAWLAGNTLRELDLPEEGVSVLSVVYADGTVAGVPRHSYTVHARDTLVLYGREDRLRELKDRKSGAPGEQAREQSEEEHEAEKRQQDVRRQAYEATRAEAA